MLLRAASSCRFCVLSCSCCALEQLVLALQLAVELLALGDVVDGDDPAAFASAD